VAHAELKRHICIAALEAFVVNSGNLNALHAVAVIIVGNCDYVGNVV
jgi:hypothetical protein